ncbi:MAG TPA: polyphosphate:AMP phosphotransferase [Syntrophales bacterium]|nr:polyphosphate:AMP phosphotransferase [Syntrophales bacterium]
MLETINLSVEMSKEDFRLAHQELDLRLGALQRRVREACIPVIIVFEGWRACGVGTAITRLLAPLDPRGYRVRMFNDPSPDEVLRPPFWRFWQALPPHGAFGIYDRSWYQLIPGPKSEAEEWYERTRLFERKMTDDGAVLVKYWLHISKQEQGKRFRKLEKDPALSWIVTKADWRENRKYDKILRRVERMLRATSSDCAPWTAVPTHDPRSASLCIARTLAEAIEKALKRRESAAKARPPKTPAVRRGKGPLDAVDLTPSLDRETYEEKLPKLQKELLRLEHLLHPRRIPVVIVYEGWDASGKGGNIKRLVTGLDNRGFQVIPVGAPAGEEGAHHFLWRFWRDLPKAGHITVFDRSWYGRVLVERVEGFAKPAEWDRAYREINEFEAELGAFGTVLVKFWIHISKDEQIRRFKLREESPFKRWKITEEDWRNRDRWDDYYGAVSDMIERTSTGHAPWTIVEGENKLYARIKTLKTVIAAVSRAVGNRSHRRGPDSPPHDG